MLGSGEHRKEASENQLKASLRVLRRQLRDRSLLADDKFQFWYQVHHQLAVWAKRLTQRLTPRAKVDVVLSQQWPDEALKRLRQRGIGNVALVLVELTRRKEPTRRHQDLVQLVYNGGLANSGVTGDKYQLH